MISCGVLVNPATETTVDKKTHVEDCPTAHFDV